MTTDIVRIDKCRLCDSQNLKKILDFGLVPLANALRQEKDLEKEEFCSPLELYSCEDCFCFQLGHNVDPNILFSDYNYETSKGLQGHFEEFARSSLQFLKINAKEAFIVGIGGNTGILEKEYQKAGATVLNIEPAKNIAKISQNNGIETISEFFNSKVAEDIVSGFQKADLITCANCFAHIPDLNEIVKGIKILMKENGVFIFENAYWAENFRNFDFGQIYAEHVLYHTIQPLYTFFKKHGLKLFHVEQNDNQSGSIRGYVCFSNAKKEDDTVKDLYTKEIWDGIYDPQLLSNFPFQLSSLKEKVQKAMKDNQFQGKSMAIYGVTAKLTLLLKFFDISKYFQYAVDESPLKVGKYVPGTKIKIVNKEYFINNPVDVIFLGAYNFKNLIIENNPQHRGEWFYPLNGENLV